MNSIDQRELRHRDRRAGDRHVAGGDAQRLGDADDDRGDERAGYRAQPTDDGDDERIGDHREVHAEIGRLARQRQRTGEAGEERAQREHRGEELALVDAERAASTRFSDAARTSRPKRVRRISSVSAISTTGPTIEQEQVVLRDRAAEPCHGAVEARRRAVPADPRRPRARA